MHGQRCGTQLNVDCNKKRKKTMKAQNKQQKIKTKPNKGRL